MRTIVLLLLFALTGRPSAAPAPRTADQRQALVDLAAILGQAHALHRTCAGPSDDTWRGRMQKLLEVEAPGDMLKARLTESFNAGYSLGEAQAKDCTTAASLEAGVARRGAELAGHLAPVEP